MRDIEKRARERLDTELRKLGLHEDAYHIGCGADLDRNDQAAINAIAASFTPPEGYVLVPVEPTEAMQIAVEKANPWLIRYEAPEIWAAMLAARPEVP